MKRKANNMNSKSIVFIIAIVLIPLINTAQGYIKNKTVQRAYAVTQDANIQITNKYGDVRVVPWEKDSVSFTIDVKVSYKKEADAEKMISNIDFVFNTSPGYVIAYTQFKNSKNDLWNDISDMAGTIFNSGNIVDINYTIYLPQTTNLRIENKYGNVYISNHSGQFTAIISNGDFRANVLSGDTKIELSLANALISKITKGKIISYYSNFEINTIKTGIIESKSSKITINSSEKLDLNSKRDKIYIDSLSCLNMVSDFSNINIYSLKKESTIQTVFGDINITNIEKDFSSFTLTSNYSDVILGIDKGASFYSDISLKKTTPVFPQSIASLQTLVINQNEYKLYGSINNGTQNSSTLTLSTTSGSLSISFK